MGRGRGRAAAAPRAQLRATSPALSELIDWTNLGGSAPVNWTPVDRMRTWGAGRTPTEPGPERPGASAKALQVARDAERTPAPLLRGERADFRALSFQHGSLHLASADELAWHPLPRGGREARDDALIFDGTRVVGRCQRSLIELPDGRLEAHHLDLQLIPALQGSGFARRFLEHGLGVYRANSVGSVHVSAGGMIGGYAWATAGFEFEAPSESAGRLSLEPSPAAAAACAIWESYGGRERLMAACEDSQAPWSLHERLEAYIASVRAGVEDVPTPAQLAGIGRRLSWEQADGPHTGRTLWPGKLILLGSEWRGVRSIPAQAQAEGTSAPRR
ncbi:hypothetical protein [Miltoncostaea oceani]|uniref:hypothetical protein n=1 Tax=Miltoncostaea oceani TaxID=2843216 RepID=UPI001C3C35F3|nr:hypothetical protein [Miltoncostaea oceani]